TSAGRKWYRNFCSGSLSCVALVSSALLVFTDAMKELPVTLLYSESLFRTIKYCSWWPENGFRTIDEARSWLSKFT
ncbi:hypothetical protein PDN92_24110, partial [Escherichia coli]|nr:hypothetical protein [Escherichia coli]MCS0769139.1 hypothetical protein [Escherichia coli]MCS0806173.1 hypothetical protein [Escherichia coli]MCS0871292.1 hypothetical protein [Escherichia coli]MCS1331110.1 hypothetical protein [Escherichia coli]